jgi:cellulose synthase/poly-beta-1,6-N-acetylglucosamine synthase-like glycosyltransferase
MDILTNVLVFLPPVAVFFLLATYNFLVYRRPKKLEKLKPPNPQGVSVYVPVFNDQNVLGSLPLLAELDYPNFTIKILDDSTNEKLKKAIALFILSHHNFSVIRRLQRTGFKGGAIENALKDETQPFICILDCDFRPPKDFLANIVSAIEFENVDVLQGYQRHIRGSESFLGTFYRASSAGSILCLSGRDRLKLAPIFSGCCALIKTDTAKSIGFAGESVTEDLNFSIRAYAQGNFKVAVRHDVYADGSCPETFKDFVTQ